MGIKLSKTKKVKKNGKTMEVPNDPEEAFKKIPRVGLTMLDNKPEWPRQIPMPLCPHQLSSGSKSIDTNCYHQFTLDEAIEKLKTTKDLGSNHKWDYIFMVDGTFRMFDTNLITEDWKKLPNYNDRDPNLGFDAWGDAKKVFMCPGHTSMINDQEYNKCLKDETSVVLYAGNLYAKQDGSFNYIDNFSGHFAPFGEEGPKVAVALGMKKSQFHREFAKVSYYDMMNRFSFKDSADQDSYDGQSQSVSFGDYQGYQHYVKRHYHVEDDYGSNYEYGGGELNYQIFGVLSLALGIMLFCMIWLIACICGGVAGYFTHGKLNGHPEILNADRKTRVEYE